MKVGMNLLLWTAAAGEEHLPILDQIKGWGFDGVEFPMFSPDCSPWPWLGQYLRDNGLESTVVAIMAEDGSLIDEDAAARQRGLDHLKASVDSCAALGAKTLAGPVYHPVGALIGRGPNDDERKRLVEGLQALGEHAQAAGVTVAVEALNRFETFMLNCQADTSAVIDAVGNDSIAQMYDTFHANIEEKSIAEAVQAGGARIKHVHVSANDRATPGEDHVDYVTTFRELKAAGYDGWLAIEAFGSWLPEIAGATCIWRKMAPSEEHLATEGLRFIRETWDAV